MDDQRAVRRRLWKKYRTANPPGFLFEYKEYKKKGKYSLSGRQKKVWKNILLNKKPEGLQSLP